MQLVQKTLALIFMMVLAIWGFTQLQKSINESFNRTAEKIQKAGN